MSECTYCGRYADSVDHVPAKIWRPIVAGEYPFFTVPACKSCNSTLGGRDAHTLLARFKFLEGYLRKKLQKYSGTPEWTEKDLMELGPGLRRRIRAQFRKKSELEARLAKVLQGLENEEKTAA